MANHLTGHLSRRSFLSASGKSALAVATYSVIGAKDAPLLVHSAVSQTDRIQTTPLQPVFARLDEYIARHMRETGAPGLTLALAGREGPLRISTYGFADTKAHAPVRSDTMFEIGSISKSFVALTLLQMHDEGKLVLEKPVVEYLPWLKINSKFEPVTTHHLLTHTAGLPGVPLLLDALLGELWTGYAPGKRFLYSNTGYNILGFLIAAIDKRPFAEAIRARLLVPLGMTASAPVITHETRQVMAVGYEPLHTDRPFPAHGPLAEAEWIEMDMAAGSIASTPADMAKYIRMILNHGALNSGRLVSEAGFDLFTRPAVKSPFRGEDASYGYGLWVSDINGHTRLRHTGGMVAFSSSIDADVTAGVGAFASVNANLRGYRPVAVTKYAVELLNASLVGKPLPDAPPPPPAVDEVKNAAEYAGAYSASDGKKLVLAADGDKLVLSYAGQAIPLERAGRDLFIVKHPKFDLFLLGFGREQGKVVEAFHGADWFAGPGYTGSRAFTSPRQWEGYVGHYHSDSPWYGDTRVVLRKGQLHLDGVQPLVAMEGGKFAINDPEAPDWVSFDSIVEGRAMRLNLSGVVFRRTFTP
jgi:CubicO group peptidase (beta-lactamase class C family)